MSAAPGPAIQALPLRCAPRARGLRGRVFTGWVALVAAVMSPATATPGPDASLPEMPLETRAAAVMDLYQTVAGHARARLPESDQIEAQALVDTGEDLLVWGETELAMELIREALVLVAVPWPDLDVDSWIAEPPASAEVDALLAGDETTTAGGAGETSSSPGSRSAADER